MGFAKGARCFISTGPRHAAAELAKEQERLLLERLEATPPLMQPVRGVRKATPFEAADRAGVSALASPKARAPATPQAKPRSTAPFVSAHRAPQQQKVEERGHVLRKERRTPSEIRSSDKVLDQGGGTKPEQQRVEGRVGHLATKPEAQKPRVYACLVDAENSSAAKLEAICKELKGYGEVAVRRMYGDFSSPALKPWKAVSNKLSFRSMTQFSIVKGKGTSDICLTLEAMDLLHDSSLAIDGFALVSSDADFTPLAVRLREGGKRVIGFGNRQTPQAFVNACHSFVYLEELDSNLAEFATAAHSRTAALEVVEAVAGESDFPDWSSTSERLDEQLAAHEAQEEERHAVQEGGDVVQEQGRAGSAEGEAVQRMAPTSAGAGLQPMAPRGAQM